MRIGKFRGIEVHIHWTFWLLILFYMMSASRVGGAFEGALAIGFILSVFFCILLHEFGHAGAAAWFGIPTRDITLLPFGGVARLESIPEKPSQELVIALAGPAVNVLIALVLLIPITLGVMSSMSAPAIGLGTDLLAQLLMVNLLLAAFNMLPAFPMDGGRVLRSVLAMRWSYLTATQIAARLGRWMSAAFVLWALFSGSWSLILVAGFIFVAGTMELLQVKFRVAQRQMQQSVADQQAWSYRPRYADDFADQSVSSERDAHGNPGQHFDADDVIDAVQVRKVQ
jgi:Zn-dependent protease